MPSGVLPFQPLRIFVALCLACIVSRHVRHMGVLFFLEKTVFDRDSGCPW